jgi:linoleoyl-CoA desaturase
MGRFVDQRPLRFAPAGAEYARLRAVVDAHFAGRTRHADARMVGKALLMLGWVLTAWYPLAMGRVDGWPAVGLCVVLGAACGGLGLNVPHDANHLAWSRRRWINIAIGRAANLLLGPSSYMWQLRHNIMHHVRPNIAGQDDTISYGGVLRIKPDQPLRRFHRWQHVYVWPLYGIVLAKWFLWDDFRWFFGRRMATYRLVIAPRDQVAFLVGKAVWLGFMVGVPLAHAGPARVALGFAIVYYVFSFILVGITQLAHVNDAVVFPDPDPSTGQISDEWLVHQLRTTADFAAGNPLVCFYAGGLNFQVVHHLFPRVCHVHHPALQAVVKRALAEQGVPYLEYPTFGAAVAAHGRFLRRMGRPVERERHREQDAVGGAGEQVGQVVR